MADFPCLLAILNTLKIFRFEKVPRSFNYEVFEVSPEAEEVYVCYEYRKSFQVFEMIKGKYHFQFSDPTCNPICATYRVHLSKVNKVCKLIFKGNNKVGHW